MCARALVLTPFALIFGRLDCLSGVFYIIVCVLYVFSCVLANKIVDNSRKIIPSNLYCDALGIDILL